MIQRRIFGSIGLQFSRKNSGDFYAVVPEEVPMQEYHAPEASNYAISSGVYYMPPCTGMSSGMCYATGMMAW